MADFRKLHIYQLAQEQLQCIAGLRAGRFGDLANQLRRAGISVVSNIVEGRGRGTDADFAQFLCIARGSNNEVGAHLAILLAFGACDEAAIARNQLLGRKLTTLIGRLRGSG